MVFTAKHVWKYSFKFFCIIGCCYQLINIGKSYFAYSTVTKVKYSTPVLIQFPELHSCFPFDQDPVLKKKYGITPKTWNEFYSAVTISEIFQDTPNATIRSCKYRDTIGHTLLSASGEECSNIFGIRKYVLQQYICYQFIDKRKLPYMFTFIHTSLYGERLMYEIRFNEILRRSSKIRMTLSTYGLPVISRNYAVSMFKRSNKDIILQLSCDNISISRLGYPYDPFFCADNESLYYDCVSECTEKNSLTTLGRLPYSSFYTKLINHTIINNEMARSEVIAKLLALWYDECSNSCRF